MIQEVVGQKVGKYFLPACSGVAFSNNEFRWSARISRGDGLVRLVPGLGTRAVDRVNDDYPVLIAPGQPNLRVNVTVEEVFKYSPKRVDLINLETNAFETVDSVELLRYCGAKLSPNPPFCIDRRARSHRAVGRPHSGLRHARCGLQFRRPDPQDTVRATHSRTAYASASQAGYAGGH